MGRSKGLQIYSVDNDGTKASLQVNVNELELTKIQDIQSSSASNTFWIGTEDQGVFRLVLDGEKYTISKTGEEFKLGSENIQAVFEDPDKQLWLCSLRSGVFKLGQPDGKGKFKTVTLFNRQNGLAGDRAKKVFQDLEGNIWIATYGDGLSLLTGQPLVFTELEGAGLDNDIQSVAVTDDKVLYLGGQKGLFRFNKAKDKFPVKISGTPADKVTALHIDGKILYIGTETSGLYVMEIGSNKPVKVAYEAYSMGNWISSIATNAKHVFLGTKDGIYQFSKDLKEEAHYSTTNGMPHNNIEDILLDSKNRLLFATRTNGIYQISAEGEISNLLPGR